MEQNELQIRLLSIAQILEGVEVKGSENWKRLASCVAELNKLAKEVMGKKLVVEDIQEQSTKPE